MTGSNHNGACAGAKGHHCECTGCSGALHGWRGWVGLAVDKPEAGEERRKKLETKTAEPSKRKKLRQAYLDLARLDIADYLAQPEHRGGLDDAGITKYLAQPDEQDGLGTADEVPDSSESEVDGSSELGRVVMLARRTMADTWRGIQPDFDEAVPSGVAPDDVKREMANHFWCSLLIALVQLLQHVQDIADLLSEKSKHWVKRALLKPSKKGVRERISDEIIDLVVGKIWSALRKLISAKLPILGPDFLRALRMLAVFSCPAPDEHRDVYDDAVVPLMNDARGIITHEVKAQVIALIPRAWRHSATPDAA